MDLEQFVRETFKVRPGSDFVMRPKIVCADGFTMSVQGSSGHYCDPRTSQDWYNSMEIGYPSAPEELIMPYIDGAEDDPTCTVYGYVPCEIIQQLIDKHGGIDVDKTIRLTQPRKV